MSLFTLNHGLLSAVNKGSGGLPSFSIKVLAVNSDESREWFENNDKFDSCDVVSQTDDTITYLIKRDDTDWSMMFVLNDDYDENPYLLEVIQANTSGVINMESMCDTCTSLTSVHLFDTSSVENMDYMLYCCESLTSVPLFDTSSVISMDSMLYDCVNVESGALSLYQQASAMADEISHSDTFYNCGSDTESGRIELLKINADWGGYYFASFKVLSVNSEESREWFTTNERFEFCEVVAQTDDTITYLITLTYDYLCGLFVLNDTYDDNPYLLQVLQADTSNVTNMREMFRGCINLTSVPLFDTSSVTNMSEMFYNCKSLTSVPLFDTSSVTNMKEMFRGCYTITSVPLFATSSVTNMNGMLNYCYSLTSVPLFDTSNVTNMDNMLHLCFNVETGALALYQQASARANEISHIYTFVGCGSDTESGQAELAQIPDDWK